MKRLIVYCLLSGVTAIIVTSIFFFRLDIFNKKIRDFSGLHYCINSKDYNDYIIIGGSNAEGALSPRIIDSIIGKTSYNLSMKGLGIIELNMILKKYLQVHPKPKAVFLMLDYELLNTLKNPHNVTDYFSFLSDTLIYNQLSHYRSIYRSKKEQSYLMFQKVLSTNDDVKNDIFPFANNVKAPENQNGEKGYCPYDSKWLWDSDIELNRMKTVEINPIGLSLLKEIINQLNNSSVQIILFYSPYYIEAKKSYKNIEEFELVIDSMAKKMNVPVWNYHQLPICKSKEYFYDMYHLNLMGAKIFSRQFAADIVKQIH